VTPDGIKAGQTECSWSLVRVRECGECSLHAVLSHLFTKSQVPLSKEGSGPYLTHCSLCPPESTINTQNGILICSTFFAGFTHVTDTQTMLWQDMHRNRPCLCTECIGCGLVLAVFTVHCAADNLLVYYLKISTILHGNDRSFIYFIFNLTLIC